MKFKRLTEFRKFVEERWSIHVKRSRGAAAPWTKDPILQKYRFTNVRREDDRVTVHVHEWAEHLSSASDADLWFAFYIARVFNKPATLDAIGTPLPWTAAAKRRTYDVLKRAQAADQRLFNAAYIVSSHGRATTSKVEYYMEIFDELWARRAYTRPKEGDTLEAFFNRLCEQPGIGGFMGAQVVADIKQYKPLSNASDFYTFARSGPGSRRGMNWVIGNDPRMHWNEREWHVALMALSSQLNSNLTCVLDAQNLQNCLCEYSKYCKVKHLEGRAKQLFRPDPQPYPHSSSSYNN